MRRALLILLVLGILIGHAAADPVRIWTDNRDFIVPAGVEAKFPLHVENSAGGEISGVFRLILTDVIDGQESGQRTESRSYTIRQGESTIVFPAGTSQTPLIRLVKVNFDYTAGMERTLALGELTVRFVADSGSPSTSASGPGLEAVPGVIQTSSIPAVSGENPPGAPDPFLTGQMTQDIESLQRELQASQEEIEQNREALNQRLVQDPSYVSINETMSSGGYSPTDPIIDPESLTEGQFFIEYKNQGETAVVQGTIERGVITRIEASSSSILPVPPEFANSERYRELMTQLAGEGFTPSGSRINLTGNEIILRSEFTGKDSGSAILTAKARNGVVQSVGVQKESGLVDYPSLFTLIILLAAMAFLLGMNRRRLSGVSEPAEPEPVVVHDTRDHTAAALGMIEEAGQLSARGELAAAYRKAGHALRYFISHRYGPGDEITDTDAIDLLKNIRSPSLSLVSQILLRCREVGFARDEASVEEFRELVKELSDLICRI